jgi:hypothetical protein
LSGFLHCSPVETPSRIVGCTGPAILRGRSSATPPMPHMPGSATNLPGAH